MPKLPNIGYPQTGDTVSEGTYACMNCPHTNKDDQSMVILQKRGKLPKCPVCDNQTYWIKI